MTSGLLAAVITEGCTILLGVLSLAWRLGGYEQRLRQLERLNEREWLKNLIGDEDGQKD